MFMKSISRPVSHVIYFWKELFHLGITCIRKLIDFRNVACLDFELYAYYALHYIVAASEVPN